jgi:hypothetical protein
MKFTRYLYEESSVKSAFVSSLLNRSDDALFWIFELFHSGIGVFDLLTQVYEDFYATNNPHLAVTAESALDAQSVANIVATMLISKFNADIFLLRKIVRELEIDRDDVTGHLKLAYQLEDEKQPISHLISALRRPANERHSLVGEVDDVDLYETVKMTPVYRTLVAVGLKSLKHESLYKVTGREGIEDAYRNNWLYYAIRTPCWANLLQNADVDEDEKEVTFKTDEEHEAFYEEWGYEPDEQPLEIQRMATCKIENVTDWVAFYKKYRGLVEIDEDFLKEL